MKEVLFTELIQSKTADNLAVLIREYTKNFDTAPLSINIIYVNEYLPYKAYISYWKAV